MVITALAFTHQIFILDYKDQWDIKLYLPFYFLEVFFIVSSIKICLMYLEWTKKKVIIIKLLFIYLAVTFFYFGVYYIFSRYLFLWNI